MTTSDRDKRRRQQILFFAGLIGLFVYLGISSATGHFQIEWLLAFLTMMGVSITQTIDKQ